MPHCVGDFTCGLTDFLLLKNAPSPFSTMVFKPLNLYPVSLDISGSECEASFGKPYLVLNLFLYVVTI